MVVVKKEGHFFIAPNDGRFALLFDSVDDVEAFTLSGYTKEEIFLSGFSALSLFEEGVKSILDGTYVQLERVSLKGAVSECAVVTEERIVGRVVYIDSYGNAITNITKESFFIRIICLLFLIFIDF